MMTKKDFYQTAIKLIGAYLFIISGYDLISYGLYAFEPWPEDMKFQGVLFMVYAVLPLFLSILIINKSRYLVRMLGLDEKDDPDTSVQFGKWNTRSIAELALILLSGYLILTNLIPFVMSVIAFFADSVSPQYQVGPGQVRYIDQHSFLAVCLNILLGGIIITNIPWFVKKLVGQYTDSENEKTV